MLEGRSLAEVEHSKVQINLENIITDLILLCQVYTLRILFFFDLSWSYSRSRYALKIPPPPSTALFYLLIKIILEVLSGREKKMKTFSFMI